MFHHFPVDLPNVGGFLTRSRPTEVFTHGNCDRLRHWVHLHNRYKGPTGKSKAATHTQTNTGKKKNMCIQLGRSNNLFGSNHNDCDPDGDDDGDDQHSLAHHTWTYCQAHLATALVYFCGMFASICLSLLWIEAKLRYLDGPWRYTCSVMIHILIGQYDQQVVAYLTLWLRNSNIAMGRCGTCRFGTPPQLDCNAMHCPLFPFLDKKTWFATTLMYIVSLITMEEKGTKLSAKVNYLAYPGYKVNINKSWKSPRCFTYNKMIQCTLQFNITFLIHPSISSIPGATSRLPAWMSGWSTAPILVESGSLQQQCFFYLLPLIHAFWKRTYLILVSHLPQKKKIIHQSERSLLRVFHNFPNCPGNQRISSPGGYVPSLEGMRPYVRSFVGWALHR